MADFCVWAPHAKSSVEVETRGNRYPMTPTDAAAQGGDPCTGGRVGWYHAHVDKARPGHDYTFIIDGGQPLPDPRSPWQPQGPTGPSRLVDHAAFPWTDHHWRPTPLSAAIFYELHIGTFTPRGTFESAIERLDHLVDLGITHVELMPVAETPGRRNWGYDGVDLFAPHHALGGPDGLKQLIDACHARGLAVFLDVVYNHLGPIGNVLPQFGPYFDDHVSTLWGKAVNLAGPHSDEVRRYFIDNSLMWLRDYHFDGLRFDAVHAFYDPGAKHILEELALEVAALQAHMGRPLALVAESDLNDPRIVHSIDAGGYGMDAQWSDDFHHALHAWITDESSGYYSGFGGPGPLAAALKNAYVYAGSYCPYRFRCHGRPAAGLPGYRFLGYIQNHDQIGNRCKGERISHLVSPERARIAAALVLTAPFIPLLFMGEEWAASSPFQYFTSHEDPEIAEATRNGRRAEFVTFGWKAEDVPDPQDEATFHRSQLDWDEISQPPHREMLAWYRQLIALRRRTADLSDGQLQCVVTRWDDQANWLVVHRGPITIAANLGAQQLSVDIARSSSADLRLLLASSAECRLEGNVLHVPPESVAIAGPVRYAN